MKISDYQFIENLKKLSFEDNWLQIIDIIEDADTLLKIDCLRYDTLEDIDLKKNIDRDKKIIFKMF